MKTPSLAATFALAVACCGHAAQIPAAADSSVSSKKAGKKYGTASTLTVDKQTNALLRFDLSSLPDDTEADHVARATLRLWVRSKPTPGELAVALPASSWTESSVTGASAPGFAPTGISALVPDVAKTFLELDVTAVVQSWLGGAANHGLLLTPAIAGNPMKVVFDSRENTQTGHAPLLDIELRNVSVFRAFTFNIPAAAWDSGAHYGDNNIYRAYDITPNLVGGVDLGQFYSEGGVVLVYVKTTGKNGYSETKQVPYVYSQGTGPHIGVKIEYLTTRHSIVISKTTNGWDSLSLTAGELPSNVTVRVVMIGNPEVP